jgi:hypothetical protein
VESLPASHAGVRTANGTRWRPAPTDGRKPPSRGWPCRPSSGTRITTTPLVRQRPVEDACRRELQRWRDIFAPEDAHPDRVPVGGELHQPRNTMYSNRSRDLLRPHAGDPTYSPTPTRLHGHGWGARERVRPQDSGARDFLWANPTAFGRSMGTPFDTAKVDAGDAASGAKWNTLPQGGDLNRTQRLGYRVSTGGRWRRIPVARDPFGFFGWRPRGADRGYLHLSRRELG